MKKEKLRKLSLKLMSDRNNYMYSFRKNVDMYIEEKDITLREVSEVADIPYSTLNTFLYGDSTDCKLSTAVKLARAFDVSIDELVGAETIHPTSKESLAICRNLPEHFLYLIRVYIRHVYKLFTRSDDKEFLIPVMLPKCKNGHLQTTNITDIANIRNLSNEIKSKVACGIKIPCEHYEPHYMPEETLLLAADRDGQNNEECVISYRGAYYIVTKKIYVENGEKKVKYISLMDGKTEMLRNEIDDKIGYIVGFLYPDGTWGER